MKDMNRKCGLVTCSMQGNTGEGCAAAGGKWCQNEQQPSVWV